ncbi:MAG: hypothetical protein AB8G05_25675 [Oligoflexales bacterium]
MSDFDIETSTKSKPQAVGFSISNEPGISKMGNLVVKFKEIPADIKTVKLKIVDKEGNTLREEKEIQVSDDLIPLAIPLEFGEYEVRTVYLDDDDNVIYDSKKCKVEDDMVNIGRRITEVSPSACKLDDEELKVEPYLSESDRLLNAEYDGPGWPKRPRKGMSIASSLITSNLLTVAVGGNIWGVGGAGATETKVGVEYASGVDFIKHAPKKDTLLFNDDGTLAFEEGKSFVAICNYTTSVSNSVAGATSVSLSPKFIPGSSSGITNYTNIAKGKTTVLNSSSKFFTIREGETPEQIQQRCQSVFVENYKHTVNRDLRKIIREKFTRDQRENFPLIMEIALNGPEKVLYANGNKIKFSPIDWHVENDDLVIKGKIGVQYKKYFVFKRYRNLCFETRLNQNYEIVEEQYGNCKGGDYEDSEWLARSKEVIQDISIETAARHLQPKDEIQFQPKDETQFQLTQNEFEDLEGWGL